MTNAYTKEIQQACEDLNAEIGSFADVAVNIRAHRISANAYFSLRGRVGDGFHSAEGKTPIEAVANLRDKWIEQKADREAAAIKEAALAIIEITYAQGQCTDASLRGATNHALTDEIIASAVSMANEMAEGGPFSVVALRGANAA